MQTFMKMAGAVYTMAGLGTIEESKMFKEKFETAMADKDQVPYFIEYSAHFFTSKMMLKYSLHTIHGR